MVVNAASRKGFPVLAPPVDAPPGPGPLPAPGKLKGTESAEVPSCASCLGDGGVALASFVGEANWLAWAGVCACTCGFGVDVAEGGSFGFVMGLLAA